VLLQEKLSRISLIPCREARTKTLTSMGFEIMPTIAKRTVPIEHMRIQSAKSFIDVRAALERTVPRLDATVLRLLVNGDVERVNSVRQNGPELSIFLTRDHGALLQIVGRPRKALQYDIGNPITASLMTRHRLSAALYAPIRVVLYEDDDGHGVFEYDLPSSTFGQLEDEQISAVARGLDVALNGVLVDAAE
jgi:uncharacterized protein (DUF302 family)